MLRPRHIFLLSVIGSVSIAALIGIGALLVDQWNDTVGRLIGTMMSITLFSLTSLGAALAMRAGLWKVAAIATFAISAFGLATFLFMIWLSEVIWPTWQSHDEMYEFMFKLMGLTATWAVALPWVALLALTRFENWLRFLRYAVLTVPTILASVITVAIITEMPGSEGIWFRAIGILSILTGLGTIALPILYRLWGKKEKSETARQSLRLCCPRCFLDQMVDVGRSRCAQCRLWFEITIEEPRCPHCRYQLHNLTRPVCPECGMSLSPDELPPTDESEPQPQANPSKAAPIE